METENKKNRRSYLLLLLALLFLLLISFVLAFIFFRMLPGTLDRLRQGEQPPSPPPALTPQGDALRQALLDLATRRRAGPLTMNGFRRKYGLRIPSAQPEGVVTSVEQQVVAEGLPYIPAPPLPWEQECAEYGGAFDLSAPEASLDFVWEKGALCLRMHRPHVTVNAGEKCIYRPQGREVNACDLPPMESICLNLLGGMGPGWADQIGAADTAFDVCDAYTRFWKWHGGWPTNRLTADGIRRGAVALPTAGQSILTRGETHYYIGSDPRLWFNDIPYSVRAEAPNIYPGIDLTCYADEDRMEYVFVLWPGADPANIHLGFDGAQTTEISPSGDLLVRFNCGMVVQHPPRVYQIVDGVPVPVDGSYILAPDGTARFAIGPRRDRTALRGEPRLDYLSFLGGYGLDRITSIAVDGQGFAYVAGESTSARLGPGTRDRRTFSTGADVFVTKYRISDSQPMYTTFFGGQGEDRALGIAVDADGNAYVCGETQSADFPATTNFATLHAGAAWDAFVVKLTPSGTLSPFAVRWGGAGDDRAYGIALDAATNVCIAGETSSRDFPATDAICAPLGSGRVDAFAGKFDSRADKVPFLTTFGGSAENSAYGIAVDRVGFLYLAGETSSRDFPTVNAGQPRFGGGLTDGFVAKLAPDGKLFTCASYLGGAGDDRLLGIAVDVARNVYLAGETSSDNLRAVNPVQRRHGGGNWDAMSAKFAGDDMRLIYAGYFGGSGDDRGFGVSADAEGFAHLAGSTTSTNLPTLAPVQRAGGNDQWDGFVARIKPPGNGLAYATYLGGAGDDQLYSVAVDGTRVAHVAGMTSSTNMPVVRPLQGEHLGGSYDGLVAGIRPELFAPPDMRLVPAGGQPGGPAYDFLMSRGEISNEEFVRFLNDAQANPGNARGTNMFFDADGNVWLNPAMQRERDEMFAIRDSRIVYDAAYAPGSRYAVTPQLPRDGGSYSNHPVACVSWYGAVKYCNWLTIAAGRGAGQRCYREGTNTWDWAPVTCAETNWVRGSFTDGERRAWLTRRGFRLPMDHCESQPGPTNEYLTVAAAEFAAFLNDAERDSTGARGANMFFDPGGSVWMSPAMQPDQDELFRIAESRLFYRPEKQPGLRYLVGRAPNGASGDFAPIGGVTWYGAMKYCNWLTLARGLGAGARAYREGTNVLEWAPVSLTETNWADCRFTRSDWEDWSRIKGVRLPYRSEAVSEAPTNAWPFGMSATSSWANAFNEFYKAGAWTGMTNANYGFGREVVTAQDANYLDSGLPFWHDTTPVGFYDGSSYKWNMPTRTNANLYGIFDLSGNVEEWLTDPGQNGSLMDRACYGGSWMFPMTALSQRMYVHPYFTDRFRGFRVVTTASADTMFVVRIPYRICLCGYGTGAGCGAGAAEEEAEPGGKGWDLDVSGREPGPDGLLPRPREEVPIPVPVPRPGPGPEKSPSGL